MIIHGDNLEALKALLPQMRGRVKCIYIDPPSNTGEEKWCYNDNVNDPRIQRWLQETLKGQPVGKEGEDLTRHDEVALYDVSSADASAKSFWQMTVRFSLVLVILNLRIFD